MINEVIDTLEKSYKERQWTRDLMKRNRNYRRICIISYFYRKGYINHHQKFAMQMKEAFDAYERETGNKADMADLVNAFTLR